MAAALTPEELLPLVDALADGTWHSGEAMAERAGLTRAALAKRVEKLAAWGLVVEARQGLGYRLGAPLERLDARALRAAVPALKRVDVLPVTDSTNQRLLDADAAQDPQALFAEFQSAGRGRRRRGWVSPFGANLYLSLAWSFPHWPADLTALPLAVGAACARALREAGVPGVGLKWPNDLLADGRKLGGILIEQRGEAGGACRAVIGLGLNFAMQDEQAAGIEQAWTSVRALCGANAPTRNALAARMLAALLNAAARFSAQGFGAFADDWSTFDLTRGQRVRIESDGRWQDGVARGVDASGALQLETAQGLQRVLAGDVSLRAA